MYEQAEFLLDHTTGGNWLLMECTGAYTFAVVFPEFKNSAKIRKKAIKILMKELKLQILPDGFQYELSPDYHSVFYSCFYNVFALAKAYGFEKEIDLEFYDIMKNAAMAILKMSTPAFTQPCTNDCFTIKTDWILKKAEEIFPEIEAFKYSNSKRAEGTPLNDYTASYLLPYAGFCVMRNDWGEDSLYMCFDVGPTGNAHIHMDKLNINIFKGSEELIFDDGGGNYEISDMRNYAISSFNHNVVIVDEKGQNREEPKILDKPVDCGWITNDKFDYAFGVYDDTFGEKKGKTRNT